MENVLKMDLTCSISMQLIHLLLAMLVYKLNIIKNQYTEKPATCECGSSTTNLSFCQGPVKSWHK